MRSIPASHVLKLTEIHRTGLFEKQGLPIIGFQSLRTSTKNCQGDSRFKSKFSALRIRSWLHWVILHLWTTNEHSLRAEYDYES